MSFLRLLELQSWNTVPRAGIDICCVLYISGCLAASLASVYYVSEATLPLVK